MKQTTVVIAAIAIAMGLLFDVLFYSKVPGVSVFVFAAATLAFTMYVATSFKAKLSKSAMFLFPLVLFFAFMVFVRASWMLALFNIVLVLYLLLLTAQLIRRPEVALTEYVFNRYIGSTARLPLRFVKEAIRGLQNAIAHAIGLKNKATYKPYVRGVLLSLPFLFVFLLLLSSADLVFQSYVNALFDFQLDAELIFRLLLVGFVASLFAGAYAWLFMRPADDDPTPKPAKLGLGPTEATIILGSVGLLFLTFLLIQVAYFFGGADQAATTGISYAEYARKGFFELITVAVISMALIWAVKKSTQHKDRSQLRTFKWLSAVLVVEVMVMMVSAHMRLSLYEEAYGFTMLRLLSHMFIVWLALTFVSLLFHIIREERENKFAFRLFASVIAFFALLSIINPDALIARQNINRFEQTNKLDVIYLSNLSEDATPIIAKLLEHPNPKLQKSIANVLYAQKRSAVNKPTPWQSANLSRQQARSILEANGSMLDANKSYYDIPQQFDSY